MMITRIRVIDFYVEREVLMKGRKSSFVCLLLAFILLFSGMCSQIQRADSMLSGSSSVSTQDEIQSIPVDSSYIRTCTRPLISGMREALQSLKIRQERPHFESNIQLHYGEAILHNLLFYCAVFAVSVCSVRNSEAAILNFIHNQDGEK